jgi:hypothetical protein
MYVYVCMCVSMCLPMCVSMCVYADWMLVDTLSVVIHLLLPGTLLAYDCTIHNLHSYILARAYVHTYVHMYVCMYVCMYIFVYVYDISRHAHDPIRLEYEFWYMGILVACIDSLFYAPCTPLFI